jgi:Diguanylate cyclase, GGDEF domain
MLLKDFLTAIRAALRTGDVIARWGEEEFALALPDCDLQQAKTIASRLLNVVPSGQTVSIGLTQDQAQDIPRAMIERADTALYAAKDGSRIQVKACQGSTPPVLSTIRVCKRCCACRASSQTSGPRLPELAPVAITEPDTAAAQVWTVHAKVRPVRLVRWRFPLPDPL